MFNVAYNGLSCGDIYNNNPETGDKDRYLYADCMTACNPYLRICTCLYADWYQ